MATNIDTVTADDLDIPFRVGMQFDRRRVKTEPNIHIDYIQDVEFGGGRILVDEKDGYYDMLFFSTSAKPITCTEKTKEVETLDEVVEQLAEWWYTDRDELLDTGDNIDG